MSNEHAECLVYDVRLKLTAHQLKVLHDLVKGDMDPVEREGYAGNDHYRALATIEKQVAAYRGRAPRAPLEPEIGTRRPDHA
jgi:hypothetical protein